MAAPKGAIVDLGSPDSYGSAFFRYLRLKHDFTQIQLAKRFKLSPGRLGRIERGHEPITNELAISFAAFFNENPQRFYGST